MYRSALSPLLALVASRLAYAQETNAMKSMISLAEWNTLIMSEASADFGAYDDPPLSEMEQEDLWAVATQWQWDYNKIDQTAVLGRGYDFAPYVVCSSVPGLSGAERFEEIYQLLEDAAIDADTVIFQSDSMYNGDDKTCRSISAESELFRSVLETQPSEVTQYLQIQPFLTSMKMIEGTFEKLVEELAKVDCTVIGNCGETDGSVTVVGGGAYGGRRKSRFLQDTSEGEDLAMVVQLAPVVLHFSRTGEVSYEEIINEMLKFTTGDNGFHVAQASFYDYSVDAGDKVTERMMFYSNVIKNVTAMTSGVGSNVCLDKVLTNDVKIARMGSNETISVRVETFGDELTEQELDDCLWYLVHALSLHPYVKFMELEAIVVPLPDDTTSASPAVFPALMGMLATWAVSYFAGSVVF